MYYSRQRAQQFPLPLSISFVLPVRQNGDPSRRPSVRRGLLGPAWRSLHHDDGRQDGTFERAGTKSSLRRSSQRPEHSGASGFTAAAPPISAYRKFYAPVDPRECIGCVARLPRRRRCPREGVDTPRGYACTARNVSGGFLFFSPRLARESRERSNYGVNDERWKVFATASRG